MVVAIGVPALGIAVYWSGVSAGRASADAAVTAHAALEAKMRSQAEELDSLEQQVRNLTTNIDIERTASSQVRSELAAAQERAEQAQQEAELYRSLIASNAGSRGLSLHAADIQQLDSPGDYRYRFTLLQRAERHVELVGHMRVMLTGTRADKPHTLGLEEIAIPHIDEQMPVKFMYFQFFEGKVRLPGDFVPAQIRVVVKISRGRPQTIDVSRAWPAAEEG